MKPISPKLKFQLKKIAVLGSLFLIAFYASFFLVNLNLDRFKKPAAPQTVNEIKINSDELKKKLGSMEVSLADGSTLSYAAWAKMNGLDSTNSGLDDDPDHSGLPNYLKYAYLTNPKNPDPNKKGFTDLQDVQAGFDPTAPRGVRPKVEIIIDKLGVTVPMVWSKSDNDVDMLKDLENGVSHFVGTAVPGQAGNMIVSGHSSNYIWAKGSYNHVFEKLNDLQAGDEVKVRMTEQNGRVITFRYKVSDKFVTAPDDARIFEDTTNPTLTLTTCWPVGTNLKRAIIKTQLVN